MTSLDDRLHAAGVDPAAEPIEAWRRLREVEGAHATILDLYELTARRRGLTAHDLAVDERRRLADVGLREIWPGFEQTADSDRTADPILVVEHDARWSQQFDDWRGLIAAELGEVARRIEHVGSTSVPDLPAKPIIDVQVSVPDLRDESSYVNGLERIGLQLRSRDDLHRYFRPPPGQPRVIHVHVCGIGSHWERDHLAFRDYLRQHASARDEYARVKRDAAREWPDDRIAYTEAKAEIILTIMDRVAR